MTQSAILGSHCEELSAKRYSGDVFKLAIRLFEAIQTSRQRNKYVQMDGPKHKGKLWTIFSQMTMATPLI